LQHGAYQTVHPWPYQLEEQAADVAPRLKRAAVGHEDYCIRQLAGNTQLSTHLLAEAPQLLPGTFAAHCIGLQVLSGHTPVAAEAAAAGTRSVGIGCGALWLHRDELHAYASADNRCNATLAQQLILS
jgi:hypothetical protein